MRTKAADDGLHCTIADCNLLTDLFRYFPG